MESKGNCICHCAFDLALLNRLSLNDVLGISLKLFLSRHQARFRTGICLFKELSHGILSYFACEPKLLLNERGPENSSYLDRKTPKRL